MDPSVLAKDIVAYLPVVLPYLLQVGGKVADKIAEETGRKVAGSAWDSVEKVWGKLRPKIESKPAATEALADLAAAPQDADAQAALRLQLKKLFAEDPQLAVDVDALWNDAKKAGVAAIGERSVAIGGNVDNSTIITGDVTKRSRSR